MSNVIIPFGAAPDHFDAIMLCVLFVLGGIAVAGGCAGSASSGKGPVVGALLGLLAMLTGVVLMFVLGFRSDDGWAERQGTIIAALQEQVGAQIPDVDSFDFGLARDAQTVTLKIKDAPVNCYIEVVDRAENETRLAVSCGNDEFRLLPTLD